MNNKRFTASILEIIIGAILIVCSLCGLVDEYWSAMGITLLVVGIIFLIRQCIYKTNKEYREKYDVERSDERNRYISGKAWAWAGYLFVISGAIGSIAFKLADREDLMKISSFSVCYIMILFWISHSILKRKY